MSEPANHKTNKRGQVWCGASESPVQLKAFWTVPKQGAVGGDSRKIILLVMIDLYVVRRSRTAPPSYGISSSRSLASACSNHRRLAGVSSSSRRYCRSSWAASMRCPRPASACARLKRILASLGREVQCRTEFGDGCIRLMLFHQPEPQVKVGVHIVRLQARRGAIFCNRPIQITHGLSATPGCCGHSHRWDYGVTRFEFRDGPRRSPISLECHPRSLCVWDRPASAARLL